MSMGVLLYEEAAAAPVSWVLYWFQYSSFEEFIVKTQRNSTQLNSKATSVGVRHSSHVYPTHPTPPTFSNTSRPARELQFGTDTHGVGF